MALFRIVQEALTNVAKHAGATRTELTVVPSGHEVRLTVADDGRGFEPARDREHEAGGGWGLRIMEERATAVGGDLNVAASPGRGTRVVVTISREPA